MPDRAKPLPQPTPETARFWEGTGQHELWMQRCDDCAQFYFYPRPFCRFCGGSNVEWRQLAGTGTLYSFVINHLPAPGFEAESPYVIALVDVTEGPRMMTNLINVPATPESITVGMPVRVVYRDMSSEITLPLFEPAPGAAHA